MTEREPMTLMDYQPRTQWFRDWLANPLPIAGGEGDGNGGEGDSGSDDNKPGGANAKTAEGQKSESDDKGNTFTPPKSQAEFDNWIKDRLTREAAQVAADTEKRIRDEIQANADAEAKKEAGKFDELYQAEQAKSADLQKEIDDLKAQMAERDRRAMRDTIARKHNLPENLWDRLVGDDEKALEEDAKGLAAVVQVKAPDTEGGAGSKRSGSKPKTSSNAPYQFRRNPIVKFPDRQ